MGIYVVGAGGHAKVVIATLRAAGYEVAGAYDDDAETTGRLILGVPVLGPVRMLEEHPSRPQVILAVGRNDVRRRLSDMLANCVDWVTAVHPRATVHESVTIGAGSIVMAGAVVQPEAALGHHVIVNTGATVDHDCVVGDHAHVAPGAHVCGNVHLETGVLVGAGSTILPGVRVGAWTIVGAGGVVTDALPAHVTVAGVPARRKY